MLVGMDLVAMDGERLDTMTHPEVMERLKAAGRPVTLMFRGAVEEKEPGREAPGPEPGAANPQMAAERVAADAQ